MVDCVDFASVHIANCYIPLLSLFKKKNIPLLSIWLLKLSCTVLDYVDFASAHANCDIPPLSIWLLS